MAGFGTHVQLLVRRDRPEQELGRIGSSPLGEVEIGERGGGL